MVITRVLVGAVMIAFNGSFIFAGTATVIPVVIETPR
jgi:hypothetical protein